LGQRLRVRAEPTAKAVVDRVPAVRSVQVERRNAVNDVQFYFGPGGSHYRTRLPGVRPRFVTRWEEPNSSDAAFGG
jgi:hypothetical protein